MEPLDLKNKGACKDEYSEIFFVQGEQNRSPNKRDLVVIEEARSVCRRCPVREECLAYAFDSGEEWGIWGGLTSAERREIRRDKAKAVGRVTLQIAEAV